MFFREHGLQYGARRSNCSSFTYPFVLHNSCWIKSDDGAIAAFIVPIVAILLV